MMRRLVFATFFGLVVGVVAIQNGRPQTSGSQSNYVFRFNTGVSGVFLNSMTFASESPLNLGACTATEKVNGPLSCVVNCNNDAVCLLELSGPPGSSVNDVLEKVSETPVPGATPAPTSSVALSENTGKWLRPSAAEGAGRRVEAYNAEESGR